jgi:hypothetical protein
MPEINVIRHVIRPHEPARGEEYDPGGDMLIVVHKNPHDPDDPVEFGHHVRLQGLAYRKEMWGLSEYSDVIEMELRDLERYYDRGDDVEYGVHPLADITEHYFEAPAQQMKMFNPNYVMDRIGQSAMPASTDGAVRFCVDTVLSGLGDVSLSLGGAEKQAFPCKGMTGLSTRSVDTRSESMEGMAAQTRRLGVPSNDALDTVKQLLTDRAQELDVVREGFVGHALIQASVPEIMRQRVLTAAVKRGLLQEEVRAWM